MVQIERYSKKKKSLPLNQQATVKQLRYLESLMSKRDFSFIKPESLTKYEASFMIRTLTS
jgi:hypothetical protein